MTNIERLRQRLDEWWPAAVAAHPAEFVDRSRHMLRDTVTETDAQSFLMGLDAAEPLYWISGRYIQSRMFGDLASGTQKDSFGFFELESNRKHISDETLAQFGAVAELVIHHGWPLDRLRIEHTAEGDLSRGSLDIITRGPTTLVAEAKRDQAGIDELVRGINACEGLDPRPEGHGKSDHNKCRGLMHYRVLLDEIRPRFKGLSQVGYDPWNASHLASSLLEAGVPMVEVRQGYASLSGPSKLFEALVRSRRIRHDGNPVMRWCAANCEVTSDPAGNIKPVKPGGIAQSTRRIDGIVAAVIALSRLMVAPDGPTSPYAHRGVRTVG